LKSYDERFQAQELKQVKSYQKNKEDLDLALEKLSEEHHRQQQNQRAEYIEMHIHTVKKASNDIVMKVNSFDSASQSGGDTNKQLQIRGKMSVNDSERKGAALRQKLRKTILMKGYSARMSVEIHNEGVAISCNGRTSGNESIGSSAKQSTSFIPWGVNARKFIHSIVCGEIPLHYTFDGIGNSSQDGLQGGGQIKCMVIDMRVDSEDANIQQTETFVRVKKQEYEKLELELLKTEKEFRSEIDREKRYTVSLQKLTKKYNMLMVLDRRTKLDM